MNRRAREGVRCVSLCLACQVQGLSRKANRPPSLASGRWREMRGPERVCVCPAQPPLHVRPAHRIRHSGGVPISAEYLQTPPYTRCFFFFLFFLLPAAEERNRKAHAENGNTAAAPCGAQSTLFKMNKQPGRCYPRLASITVDKAFLEALWCRPARREGRGKGLCP
jgi:hypothetical protein